MKLFLAAVCEYANQTRDGSLNVMGVIDHLRVTALPAVKPQMMLALAFRVEEGEFDSTQKLGITLAHVETKAQIIRVQAPLTIRPRLPEDIGGVRAILAFNAVPFDRAGGYEFEIKVGRKTHTVLPFEVRVLLGTPPATGGLTA